MPAHMPRRENPLKISKRLWFVGILALALAGVLCPVARAESEEGVESSHHTEMTLKKLEKMGAEYVGAETCATCHEAEHKEFKLSTHARISSDKEGLKAQGCEMCHGPGSVHVENGGGKGSIVNPKKSAESCFACHSEKRAEFKLPSHHPVLEGKMSCTDCHSPHGMDAKPWSATSINDVNEACFKCHKEQRGPFVWEHEAVREGCTTCHKVHGSVNDKMLVARDSNLCLRCHTQVNFPTMGKSGHAGNLVGGSCFSAGCHTGVHGSNFDDHLRS